MSETLVENPVLLLFLVIGVGYLVGQVRYRGFGLGVGAVLFAGLIAGGIDNALVIPPVFLDLGLALFVYTIGLAAGPGFVASLRRRGLRANALVLVVLAAMTGLAVGLAELCGFSGPTTAGIFSGALTNTPALASSVATLTSKGLPSTAPVVSYSLCYPVGVIGVLLAVSFYRRRFFKQPVEDSLVTHTVVVGADLDRPLNQIAADENLDVRFVRVAHDEHHHHRPRGRCRYRSRHRRPRFDRRDRQRRRGHDRSHREPHRRDHLVRRAWGGRPPAHLRVPTQPGWQAHI